MKIDTFYLDKGWKKVMCFDCSGTGVSNRFHPDDFNECNTCQGRSYIWQTPKNKYVSYPGGPFV